MNFHFDAGEVARRFEALKMRKKSSYEESKATLNYTIKFVVKRSYPIFVQKDNAYIITAPINFSFIFLKRY